MKFNSPRLNFNKYLFMENVYAYLRSYESLIQPSIERNTESKRSEQTKNNEKAQEFIRRIWLLIWCKYRSDLRSIARFLFLSLFLFLPSLFIERVSLHFISTARTAD